MLPTLSLLGHLYKKAGVNCTSRRGYALGWLQAREEMTERDWRIFREDFSIAYKGNAGGTLPIRNWKEARLPEPLMKVRGGLFRRMPKCLRTA